MKSIEDVIEEVIYPDDGWITEIKTSRSDFNRYIEDKQSRRVFVYPYWGRQGNYYNFQIIAPYKVYTLRDVLYKRDASLWAYVDRLINKLEAGGLVVCKR